VYQPNLLGVDIVMHDRSSKTCTIQLDGDDRRKISRMQINLLTQEMRHINFILLPTTIFDNKSCTIVVDANSSMMKFINQTLNNLP